MQPIAALFQFYSNIACHFAEQRSGSLPAHDTIQNSGIAIITGARKASHMKIAVNLPIAHRRVYSVAKPGWMGTNKTYQQSRTDRSRFQLLSYRMCLLLIIKAKTAGKLVVKITGYNTIRVGFFLCWICLAFIQALAQEATPSLQEIYKNDFLIGTALNTQQIEEKDSGAARLIPQQFNAITPENIMKAQSLHPGWDTYDFTLADKLVAYAKKNNIKVNAHTLIWHSQLPSFMRRMQSADSVRQYFTNHITTVAGRYDGKVYSWDVVNEALNEDGTLRKSIFLEKLGADYIVEAFRLAQKAAPNTKLYYNDYSIEQPAKRAGAIAIIKKIQAACVRIDGVGIQGHWNVENTPVKDIEESIQEFGALGIEVMFTELDLSVLPNPQKQNTADISNTIAYNDQWNPYVNGLPDSVAQKQAKVYGDLFKLFLKYDNYISRVTLWGVDDRQSWLNDFPVRGRTNYALLFDRNYQPKPAFYSVAEAKTSEQKH